MAAAVAEDDDDGIQHSSGREPADETEVAAVPNDEDWSFCDGCNSAAMLRKAEGGSTACGCAYVVSIGWFCRVVCGNAVDDEKDEVGVSRGAETGYCAGCCADEVVIAVGIKATADGPSFCIVEFASDALPVPAGLFAFANTEVECEGGDKEGGDSEEGDRDVLDAGVCAVNEDEVVSDGGNAVPPWDDPKKGVKGGGEDDWEGGCVDVEVTVRVSGGVPEREVAAEAIDEWGTDAAAGENEAVVKEDEETVCVTGTLMDVSVEGVSGTSAADAAGFADSKKYCSILTEVSEDACCCCVCSSGGRRTLDG